MQDRKGAQQGPSTNRKQLSVWLPLINIIKVGSYIIQTKKNHSSISLMRGVSCAVNANAPGNDIVIQMIYACINGQRAYQNELRRRASSVSYSPWRCMSVSAKKICCEIVFMTLLGLWLVTECLLHARALSATMQWHGLTVVEGWMLYEKEINLWTLIH